MRERLVAAYRKSGIGLPFVAAGTNPPILPDGSVADRSYAKCMFEAKQSLCGAVGELLRKTGVAPRSIDVVVTACTLFTPVPSLASMLVHEYDMRPDVVTVPLAGAGCSAGVLGLQVAADMLAARPGSRALFACFESTATGTYVGHDPTMQLPMMLFRQGGAAVLLTNCPSAGAKAKYVLAHSVRVHAGADDKAYG